jgi:putative SOS response-associated peptidase YedK
MILNWAIVKTNFFSLFNRPYIFRGTGGSRMCGRYVIQDEKEIEEINKIISEINEKYNGTGLAAKKGEIFPTDNAPVLSMENSRLSVRLMKWGFPMWTNKGVSLNAKGEGVSSKKMFAKAFFERRCVIPATGFYEWSHDEKGKAKDKFLFNSPDSPMLYMAGFYTDFADPGAALSERFVIMTRAANDSINDLHDRMPVILYKHELSKWVRDVEFARYVISRDDVELVREAV